MQTVAKVGFTRASKCIAYLLPWLQILFVRKVNLEMFVVATWTTTISRDVKARS